MTLSMTIFSRMLPVICLLATACNRSPEYYLKLGNDLFNSGKFEEASINYRKAIQKRPKFGEAFYRLALSETKSHLPMNGYVDLKRAIELMPANEQVLTAMGELAVGIYTVAPQHPKDVYEEASRVTEQLLQKNRDGFDGNRFRGALLLIDRKPGEAVAYLRKAVAAKPDDQETTLGFAQALLESGQEQEGTDLARGLIHKDETFAKAYDLLSRHYLASRNPQEAESILKLKVANNPGRGEFVLQLAAFYATLPKPELVAPTLQPLIDRPAAFPNARLAIGDFYSSLGKPDDALRQYQAGLSANPKDKTPYRNRMIRILSSQRKWPEAYEQVDLLLKEKPDDAEAKLARVSLWLEEGKLENLDRAISELRLQLAGKPVNPAFLHFQLGSALERQGDRDGARSEWTAAR